MAFHEPKPLTGTHLTTYEAIGKLSSGKVVYDDFKSLWEYLGGEIPNPKSGGSHRTLKFNGKAIGGTFVPHYGNDDYYRPSSMKYLRDALNELKPYFSSGFFEGL